MAAIVLKRKREQLRRKRFDSPYPRKEAGTGKKNLEKQETETSAREVNQEKEDALDVEIRPEKVMSETAASHETGGAIETNENGEKEVHEIRAFTSHRQKIVKARKKR